MVPRGARGPVRQTAYRDPARGDRQYELLASLDLAKALGGIDPAQNRQPRDMLQEIRKKAKARLFAAFKWEATQCLRHDFTENGRAARVACNLSHTPASRIAGNARDFPMPLIQRPSQSGRRKVNCGIVFGTTT